jgi:Protein of unknwon function (DUF3008)
MPSVSQAQQRFMGAELARKREGKSTKTGMSESQLRDFAGTKRSNLPARKSSDKPAFKFPSKGK